jgi:hypothetical protein
MIHPKKVGLSPRSARDRGAAGLIVSLTVDFGYGHGSGGQEAA